MVERLARLGFISSGIVYILIGFFAAARGLGRGSAADHDGALHFIRNQPFGHVFLALIAAGLTGYAIWRLAAGVTDSDARGSDAKGIGVRVSSIARGLAHLVIAWEVVRLLLHRGGGESEDAQAKHWTGRLMDAPYGRWLVAAAGLTVLGYGIYQLYKAWESKLGKRIRMTGLDASVKRKAVAISRFGIGARGVVFLVIGGSLIRAAMQYNPNAARGTKGALQQLAEPFGGWLLVAVGVGLAAYGVYAFVNARYRLIRA